MANRDHRLVALFADGSGETRNRIDQIVIGLVDVISDGEGPFAWAPELVIQLRRAKVLVRNVAPLTGNSRKPVQQASNRIAQLFEQDGSTLARQRKKVQIRSGFGIHLDRSYARIVIRTVEALGTLGIVAIRPQQSDSPARRRHRQYGRLALSLTRSLIAEEEERLVANDGPAERAAVLVALELRFYRVRAAPGFGRPVVRIEIVIAQKLEQRAVERVRA